MIPCSSPQPHYLIPGVGPEVQRMREMKTYQIIRPAAGGQPRGLAGRKEADFASDNAQGRGWGWWVV